MVKRKHYLLRIREIRQETAEAIQVIFDQPQAERIYFKAGQFLTLVIRKEDQVFYRSYSLCSIPRLDDFLAIVIKRVEGGAVSPYLLDNLRVGQMVEVLPAAGRFFIENSVKFQRHLVMIAGGSGITPIMSMLQAALYNEPHSRVSLLYANRSKEDIIFHEKLKELQSRFTERFQILHFLSRETEAAPLPYYPFRLDTDRIPQAFSLIPQTPDLSKEYYLCGPNALMEQVHQHLTNSGISTESIYQEHFTQAPAQQDDWANEPVRSIILQMSGTSHTVEVAPGATILDAGLDAGLDMPFSCRSGNCASCMAKLHSGTISMDNPQALLPFEEEQGFVLTCQAHPKDEEVVVVY